MTSPAEPRDPADAWVDCTCGGRHWGLRGAAGLLLTRPVPDAAGLPDAAPHLEVLLQLRGERSHHGGTWGLPGGARKTGEQPLATALREAHEEAGLDPALVTPRWWRVVSHGPWTYTTVVAEAPPDLVLGEPNWESAQLEWVANPDDGRTLHPGFAAAWPALAPLLGARLELIVDNANVVGSRPDGWWKDRRQAAARLRDQLEDLATIGLPQALIDPDGPDLSGWWPDVTLVVEGQARGLPPGQHVTVVEALGDGDDEIARRAASGTVVVTADKYLKQRVKAKGAQILAPGRLLSLLQPA